MSLFNTRQGPRADAKAAARSAADRVQRLKAARMNMDDAKLPPRTLETMTEAVEAGIQSPRRADGTEESWDAPVRASAVAMPEASQPRAPQINIDALRSKPADLAAAGPLVLTADAIVHPVDEAHAGPGQDADAKPADDCGPEEFVSPEEAYAAIEEELSAAATDDEPSGGADEFAAIAGEEAFADGMETADEEAAPDEDPETAPAAFGSQDDLEGGGALSADDETADTPVPDALQDDNATDAEEASGTEADSFEDEEIEAEESAGEGSVSAALAALAAMRASAETAQAVAETDSEVAPAPAIAEFIRHARQPAVNDMALEAAEPLSVAGSPVARVIEDFAMPGLVPDLDDMAAPEGEARVGRGRRNARNRTRLLGFDHAAEGKTDLFEPTLADTNAPSVQDTGTSRFPVGWLVVVEGPGAGHAFTLYEGLSQIGRGEGQRVRLDFGDSAVSRENHAAIAYDTEDHSLTLAQSGKANLVRLNNKPVLSNEELCDGDIIRIGTTKLRVVQLCTGAFNWDGVAREDGDEDAAL